jgi:hypothetical protein
VVKVIRKLGIIGTTAAALSAGNVTANLVSIAALG